jgi:hypothetical protein
VRVGLGLLLRLPGLVRALPVAAWRRLLVLLVPLLVPLLIPILIVVHDGSPC